MLLLVSFSFAFQYLLCFVHGQDQGTKEIKNKTIHIDKETGKFHNHFHFINHGVAKEGPSN